MKKILPILLFCVVSCAPHQRTPEEEAAFQRRVQEIKDSEDAVAHQRLRTQDSLANANHPIVDTTDRAEHMKKMAYLTARDTVQLMYNDVLSYFDSLSGTDANVRVHLRDRNSEISRARQEINTILRNENATHEQLTRAKELIDELKKLH